MNKKLVPASKPQMTREALLAKIKQSHPNFTPPLFFVAGIRGYYLDSMGEKGSNDRCLYDDAIFLVGKTGIVAFNANTDPSAFKRGIASLVPGVWPVYKFDKHRGQTAAPYLALCQRAGNVKVLRDGKEGGKPTEDIGSFGINIHRGGSFTTSSLGCQTIPPAQYDGPEGFIATAQAMAKEANGEKYAEIEYTYVLLENKAPQAIAPDIKKPEKEED